MSKKPRTTCDLCGRTLSQAALKRHRGTEKCIEDHWKRELRPQYAVPPGYAVAAGPRARFAWRIQREAQLFPPDGPVTKRVVWSEDGDAPFLATIMPAWMVDALECYAWLDPGFRASSAAKQDAAAEAKRQRLWQDLVALVAVYAAEDHLELSMEIKLSCHKKGEYGRRLEYKEAVGIVRDRAKEVLP